MELAHLSYSWLIWSLRWRWLRVDHLHHNWANSTHWWNVVESWAKGQRMNLVFRFSPSVICDNNNSGYLWHIQCNSPNLTLCCILTMKNSQSLPQGLRSRGTSCEHHRLRTFLGARRAAGAEYFSWHPFLLWTVWSPHQCALLGYTPSHSNYRLPG